MQQGAVRCPGLGHHLHPTPPGLVPLSGTPLDACVEQAEASGPQLRTPSSLTVGVSDTSAFFRGCQAWAFCPLTASWVGHAQPEATSTERAL